MPARTPDTTEGQDSAGHDEAVLDPETSSHFFPLTYTEWSAWERQPLSNFFRAKGVQPGDVVRIEYTHPTEGLKQLLYSETDTRAVLR